MTVIAEPQIGVDYSYDDIVALYKADDAKVEFVVLSRRKIRALRLRHDYHQRIFQTLKDVAEVWVGEEPKDVKSMGARLADFRDPLPVFVKKTGAGNYTFIGNHQVLDRKATPTELEHARGAVPHKRGVSRIVFLKKV